MMWHGPMRAETPRRIALLLCCLFLAGRSGHFSHPGQTVAGSSAAGSGYVLTLGSSVASSPATDPRMQGPDADAGSCALTASATGIPIAGTGSGAASIASPATTGNAGSAGKSQLPPDARILPIERLELGGRSLEVVSGELLVKFASSVSADERARRIDELGGRILAEDSATGYLKLGIPPGTSIREFRRRLTALAGVVNAQPNVVMSAAANKCNTSAQYYSYQWHLNRLDQPQTCSVSGASPTGVVVAVLDSGLAYENYNGYIKASDLGSVPIVSPKDYINNDNHPNDDQQHGTHIALTIAGQGKAMGVTPGVSLMPVKVLDASNRGDEFALAQGIRWAADHGAHIINMSLAFPNAYIPSGMLQEAVRHAAARGVLMVASSGNDGSLSIPYPAAFREVLSVGATRMKRLSSGQVVEEIASYSNRGPGLDLVAYGGDNRYDSDVNFYPDGLLAQSIRAQTPGQTAWFFMSGTSQAGAVVSGVAAWLVAMGATTAQARDTMLQTAVDLGTPGYDTTYGQGMVHLYRAVDFFRTQTPTPSPRYYVNLFPVVYKNAGQEWGVARVRVLDALGAPVVGATVHGEWTGSTALTSVSSVTDAAGYALLSSPALADDADGSIFAFQVSAVVSPGGRAVAPVDAYYTSEGMTRLLARALGEPATYQTMLALAVDAGDPSFSGLFDLSQLAECLVLRAVGPTLGTPGAAVVFTPDYLPELAAVQAQDIEVPLDGELGFGNGTRSSDTVTVYDLGGVGLMTSGLVRSNADGTGLMTSGLSRMSGGMGLMTSGLSKFDADPAFISGASVSGPVDVVFAEAPDAFLDDNPGLDPELAAALNETRFGANTADSSDMAGIVYEASSQSAGEDAMEAEIAESFSILEFNWLLTLLTYIIFG